jgi:hypothetical protein
MTATTYSREHWLTQATGDILTFLGADDVYLPGWLARLEEVYARGRRWISSSASARWSTLTAIGPHWEMALGDFDFGLTFYRTATRAKWLGSPTSALSAWRALLTRFLPCSLESEWR